ncbi:MAG: hypothetical protein Q4D94_03900 [Bacillota bacterium]|nr:hypothetical protein [Bacillota bacterium]
MKIINRQNFFPIVCVVFTLLIMGKVILEAVLQGLFGGYQENILIMFVLSLLATFVLSQHYRFQRLPLLLVIVIQYVVIISVVMLITWAGSFFEPLHEDGYRDMFRSFTVPYVIGAVIYYISLFYEVRGANKTLMEIKEYRDERNKEIG